MLAAVYLELDQKANIEQLTEFYQCAMGNFVMQYLPEKQHPIYRKTPIHAQNKCRKKSYRETILTHGNSTLEQVKT